MPYSGREPTPRELSSSIRRRSLCLALAGEREFRVPGAVADRSARAPRRRRLRDGRRTPRRPARAHERGRRRALGRASPARGGADRFGQEPGLPRRGRRLGFAGRRRDVHDRVAEPADGQGSPRAAGARDGRVLVRVAEGTCELPVPREAASSRGTRRAVRATRRSGLRAPARAVPEIRAAFGDGRPFRVRPRGERRHVEGRHVHEPRMPGQSRLRRRRGVLRGAGARPRSGCARSSS